VPRAVLHGMGLCPYELQPPTARKVVATSLRRATGSSGVGSSPESIEPSSGAADPVIVLGAQPGAASRSAWCERVRCLLIDGSATVVICDVAQLTGPATDVLDTLAYMQLTARRCGGQIRLRHPHQWLVQLLELTGLAVALPAVDEPEP